MPEATINGYKHHWIDEGTGEALIMMHSAASAGAQFMPHVEELSKTFRLIIPDMRGMGRSERIESIPPSAWVDDMEGLLDHLGIQRCNVFGTSLGARMALRLAINRPERVSTLFLDNPIVANEQGGNDALNSRLENPDMLPPEAQQRYETMHGGDWRDVVRAYFRIRNDSAVQDYFNLRELAKGVETPTLISRGDNRQDVTHPLPHAIELAYSLRNSRLWIKPEGGCLATREGYERIRQFVAETSPVTSA